MSVWIPIAISAAMLAISLTAFLRTAHRDGTAEAAERAKMAADVTYIRASVDDIRAESRITRSDVKSLENRVTKLEASAASAHRRLDEHKKGSRVS